MTSKKTFLQTATLIEDILGVKKVSYVFHLVGNQMEEGVSDDWILKPNFFKKKNCSIFLVLNYLFVLLKYIQVKTRLYFMYLMMGLNMIVKPKQIYKLKLIIKLRSSD